MKIELVSADCVGVLAPALVEIALGESLVGHGERNQGAAPLEAVQNSSWIDALAELRQRAPREGYCYQHVQAITVAIDQYAEKALGNRDYFLNKPYGAG
jgi:hypothetical protein